MGMGDRKGKELRKWVLGGGKISPNKLYTSMRLSKNLKILEKKKVYTSRDEPL